MGKEARGNIQNSLLLTHVLTKRFKFSLVYVYRTNLFVFLFAAMRKTERLKSEHASERDSVIASEHRLSHVSVGKLLRRGHPGAVRIGRSQVLQHILVR